MIFAEVESNYSKNQRTMEVIGEKYGFSHYLSKFLIQ